MSGIGWGGLGQGGKSKQPPAPACAGVQDPFAVRGICFLSPHHSGVQLALSLTSSSKTLPCSPPCEPSVVISLSDRFTGNWAPVRSLPLALSPRSGGVRSVCVGWRGVPVRRRSQRSTPSIGWAANQEQPGLLKSSSLAPEFWKKPLRVPQSCHWASSTISPGPLV